MTSRILIIAGSDSGGGAGVQADIKTVTMLGGFAMSAITAITAQNTLGVQDVSLVDPDMVMAQMASCIEDIGVDAIKIGMVPTADCASAIGGMLLAARERLAISHGREARPYPVPVVVDPVIVATSGARLIDDAALDAICARILPFATLMTPNLPELEALGGTERALAHGCALLAKGGHAEGELVTDRLLTDAGEVARWDAPRIDTGSTHGTGCTFAAALAAGLAHGLELTAAARSAKRYVSAAIAAADSLWQELGTRPPGASAEDGAPATAAGHGPVHHFHALWPSPPSSLLP